MLTAADFAVSKIRQAIPREILEKTFIDQVPRFKSVRNAVSLDNLIKRKVVRDIVLTDCNLIGANEIDIAVMSSWCQVIDSNNYLVRIPKSHTQNRTITEVTTATYLPQSGYVMPYGSAQSISDQTMATNKLLNNIRDAPIVGTPDCEVVGENVISVIGGWTIPSNMFLTVMVEHDDQMSKLRRPAYLQFAELCILACKAYIWTNRIIEMDKAEVHGGYQLNRFTSIIESYEDAYEQYTEYFNEKWKKISFMADPARNKKYLKMITRVGL